MAFGKGFQINKLITNTSECFYRIQNNTHVVIPEFFGSLTNNAYDFNVSSNTNNFTLYSLVYSGSLFLHNVTNDLTFCTSALNYSLLYLNRTRETYKSSCRPVLLLTLSILQNFVSNAISIYNIRKSYLTNIETLNRTGVAFDLGRLFRTLFIFPVFTTVDHYNLCEIFPDVTL